MNALKLTIPDQITLPCITLWQPWATWIRWGWKTIETRTHARFAILEKKTIGIHAGLKWDDSALDLASEFLTKAQLDQTREFRHSHGAIICTAFVHAFATVMPMNAGSALIECETERYGLFLHSVKPVDPPIQAKGSQGIWRATIPAFLVS